MDKSVSPSGDMLDNVASNENMLSMDNMPSTENMLNINKRFSNENLNSSGLSTSSDKVFLLDICMGICLNLDYLDKNILTQTFYCQAHLQLQLKL